MYTINERVSTMRIVRFFLHIIGFVFTILVSAFQLALHLAMSILSLFFIALVKSSHT